jgi:Mce-associated membrane protein
VTVDDDGVKEATSRPVSRRLVSGIVRAGRGVLAWWRPILLTVLVFATTGFCAGYFFFVYRQDLQTDKTVTNEVIKAASEGAVALLSYSPDTLGRDMANAKTHLTENYLAYYQRFIDQIVEPSSQRAQVTTTATVVKAGVSELQSNSAVVLVFIKQTAVSKEKPQPVITSSSLRVTLSKEKGSWLIEKFEAT